MRTTILALVSSILISTAALSAFAADGGDEIVLYYAEWCGYCTKARAWLDENDIAYEKRNVDEPRFNKELQDISGRTAIPVLSVGGELIRGFRPSDYQQAFGD